MAVTPSLEVAVAVVHRTVEVELLEREALQFSEVQVVQVDSVELETPEPHPQVAVAVGIPQREALERVAKYVCG